MKKISDLLKANILIFFGALLFLLFLNYFSNQDGLSVTMGIFGVLVALFDLVYGILGFALGKRFKARRIFDIISVCSFALLMFLVFLLTMIANAQRDGYMGPTAWIIAIYSVAICTPFAVFYALGRCINKNGIKSVSYLFTALFLLALLLDILFTGSGAPTSLGGLALMSIAIYLLFSIYLFGTLKEEGPARLPAPKAEEEPAPEEEAPAEEAEAQPEEAKEE